ncbi:MAG: ABC transporter ATP-binding protein [Thermaerobacter sp.]|nr:ABC transporter ATP-binding protein [Thermaerobacter sp.]
MEHVTKQFGATSVVRDVNLDVKDREFLVLLGPSGCGKTTILRMIAGLETMSEGRISIGDRDVSDLAPKDRDIAMVFQNYALYPHMTVFENIAFSLRTRKVPQAEIERRVSAAAESLGLAQYLQRRPRELSGGQRQRVALGRAIVRQPAAFLMDEPLSNLDAKLRAQTRIELKRLHEQVGGTTIYVTHDQVEAMTMGSRVVVMHDGVMQQVDTPEGIYARPVNLFVAGFVGTPAINVVPAATQAGTLVVEGQRLPMDLSFLSGDQRVVLGVRPEDVHLDRHFLAEHPDAVLRGQVRLVEPMGHEKIVTIEVGESALTARVANEWNGVRDENVTLGIDVARVTLFDVDTGVVLARHSA